MVGLQGTFYKLNTTMKTIVDNNAGKEVIVTLQQMLVEYGFPLVVDGIFGKGTRQAVKDFQNRHGLVDDGIAGYRTWEALFFANRDDNLKTLSENDFRQVARLLDCEPAALMAVQQVETGGRGGFFNEPDRTEAPILRPVILFEGHVFWEQLKDRGINPGLHVKGNENILYPQWSKAHYAGGVKEYERLYEARAIHREAADASASWGMFQIMGFNYAACGEKSVASFVDMMYKSELHQLLLSCRFINHNKKMLSALQQKDWAEFARCYNGLGYAKNSYDDKLAAAYKSFSE